MPKRISGKLLAETIQAEFNLIEAVDQTAQTHAEAGDYNSIRTARLRACEEAVLSVKRLQHLASTGRYGSVNGEPADPTTLRKATDAWVAHNGSILPKPNVNSVNFPAPANGHHQT